MENPYSVYRVLVKFMDAQYVDSFLSDGLIFMNNIDYFRKYEDVDTALRGDTHEGLAASYRADQSIIQFGDHVIEGAVGKIDVRYDHEDETNIYCMTKISDGKILEWGNGGLYLSQKFLRFGNRAIVIGGSNITEFERRISRAIASDEHIFTPRKDGVVAQQVSYLSRHDHHEQMDVFNKFDQYSWQYEWRIAFKRVSGTGPYRLKIGSLADIAEVFETESLIAQPLKLVSNNS